MSNKASHKPSLKWPVRVRILQALVVTVVIGLAAWLWWLAQAKGLPEGFAAGNGLRPQVGSRIFWLTKVILSKLGSNWQGWMWRF